MYPGRAERCAGFQPPEHEVGLQGDTIDQAGGFRADAIDLEPDLALTLADLPDTVLHDPSAEQAAVGDQPEQRRLRSDELIEHPRDDTDGSGKLARAGRFAIPRKGDIDHPPGLWRRVPFQIIAMEHRGEEHTQFRFQPTEVDRRWPAARQVGHLAVDAAPIAGVVRVQVDADRHATRAPGNHRIDIGHAAAVAIVICDGEPA